MEAETLVHQISIDKALLIVQQITKFYSICTRISTTLIEDQINQNSQHCNCSNCDFLTL